MLHLADRLSGFAAALLDPTRAVPAGLVGPDGEPSAKRFAVYRNNVVVGLTEALQANFPAVCRIVGEEFFQAMARAYVVFEAPVSPILLDYGDGFASFIAEFEPAASLPYLADVARIERAWTQAYNAPEAVSLGWFSSRVPAVSFQSPACPFVPRVRSAWPCWFSFTTVWLLPSEIQMLLSASMWMPWGRLPNNPSPKDRRYFPFSSNSTTVCVLMPLPGRLTTHR